MTAQASFIQNKLLKGLNDTQRKCVTQTFKNNTLCIAGAGSGKTTVIAKRIAFITAMGHSTDSIAAVTFTTKAAKELQERVALYIGEAANNILIGTFHSICLKLLRQFAYYTGKYTNDFSVINPDSDMGILKIAIDKILGYSNESIICDYKDQISKLKNRLISPEQYMQYINANQETNYTQHKNGILLASVYKTYMELLYYHNVMDYDDFIINTLEILNIQAVRDYCWNRFKFIMCDESQDTNIAQFKLIETLAGSNNIFLVGDVDQSIYEWRGAKFENMFKFLRKYPTAETIKLTQNYRSSKTIVEAANTVIKNNKNRFEKVCFTQNHNGDRIKLRSAMDSKSEVKYIADEIQRLIKSGYNYKDIAVLYRINALGHDVKKELIIRNIPYSVILNNTISADNDEIGNTNTVKLQTVHSAKGLEYRAVFVIGLEENTFPYLNLSEIDAAAHREEERRLFYVAITRAKEKLYLTNSCKRTISGACRTLKPSLFLSEIPRSLLQFA